MLHVSDIGGHTRTAAAVAVLMVVSAVGSGVGGSAALAGPLNPPAGPMASTPGPEPRTPISATTTPGDADSLFKITQPGSYYLTGNVTGVTGKHGIEIAASDVTVDLNGFALRGVAGMGAFCAVTARTLGLHAVSVLNGSVLDWDGGGVDLGSVIVYGGRIDGVVAADNAVAGIRVGARFVVSNCAAYFTAGTGIVTDSGCTLSNCTSSLNLSDGFRADPANVLVDCAAYGNSGHGFVPLIGSMLTRCGASGNGGNGFIASLGCGILECAAAENGNAGIVADEGCTVAACTANANTDDGIRVGAWCWVRVNTCDSNGAGGDGAGVHALGGGNRLEGNACTDNDRGIDVDGAGNMVAANTCSGNTTNWTVVAGNVCLVVSATTGGVISGNAGGTGPGSVDPRANFTY